ncbi:MAG: WD40 repeat domain-containing protein [Fuerstiella sp.]|nr:hypothetical protein [Fuerstiella sp.]
MKPTSLNQTARFKMPTGILGTSVSDDGTSLVAACMDGIYLVDPRNESSEKIGQHGSSAAFLPEREPSVKIISAKTGEIQHSLPHVPSVQAVAFSPDGQFVAAGNLMGEVRVWNAHSAELAASFTTPDFTSWGIIKSHCYLGGIFALEFTPDGKELLLAGMGPMRDPMAGNGRQLWQKWAWTEPEPRMIDETHKGESGEGLMETLAVHPDGQQFVMGGRLRGGDWNATMFDLAFGARIATLKTGFRVTEAIFTLDGHQLILVGAQGQPKTMVDGVFPDFGQIEVYDVAV